MKITNTELTIGTIPILIILLSLYIIPKNYLMTEGQHSTVTNIIGHGRHVYSSADRQFSDDSTMIAEIGHGRHVYSLAERQFSDDSTMIAERRKYMKKLKQTSYSFNTPYSVKIDAPFTIYFFLNPLDQPQKLAEKLRLHMNYDPSGKDQRIEANSTKWSAKMRVTLTGQDFEITPVEGNTFDGIKTPFPDKDTSWSWRIQAKHDGDALPLHLNVWCELPAELGGPVEMIPTLNRYIRVDVTPIWILNTYWERWKWIFGGIGTAFLTAFGFWWKSRHTKKKKLIY